MGRVVRKVVLGVAVSVAVVLVGTGAAIGHGGFPDLLHSQHSQVMNGRLIAQDFRYLSPKQQVLAVSHLGFAPHSTAVNYNNSDTQGITTGGFNCFNTSLPLPNRSRITLVSFYYTTTAAGDLQVSLLRQRFATASGAVIQAAQGADTGGNPGVVHLAVDLPVNTAALSYGVQVCFADVSTTFHGARVVYQVPAPS